MKILNTCKKKKKSNSGIETLIDALILSKYIHNMQRKWELRGKSRTWVTSPSFTLKRWVLYGVTCRVDWLIWGWIGSGCPRKAHKYCSCQNPYLICNRVKPPRDLRDSTLGPTRGQDDSESSHSKRIFAILASTDEVKGDWFNMQINLVIMQKQAVDHPSAPVKLPLN